MTTSKVRVHGDVPPELIAHAEQLAAEKWAPKPRLFAVPIPDAPKPIFIEVVWHILVTEPNRENTAAAGLVGRGFDAYSPIIKRRVKQRRDVTRAMFPGYVFVLLPVIGGSAHDRAASIPGVRGFLTVAQPGEETPRRATLTLVEVHKVRLKEAELSHAKARLPVDVGDVVSIEQDIWQGHLGTIETLDDKGRAEVLISLFGRETVVKVSFEHLKAI